MASTSQSWRKSPARLVDEQLAEISWRALRLEKPEPSKREYVSKASRAATNLELASLRAHCKNLQKLLTAERRMNRISKK